MIKAEHSQRARREAVQRSRIESGVLLAYGDSLGRCDGSYRMAMNGSTTVLSQGRTQLSTIQTEMLLSQRSVKATTEHLSLETRIDAGTIVVNGAASPIPMIGRVVRTQMARDGTIVDHKGFSGLDLKSMQLVLPRSVVKRGHTWTVPVPATASVPIALEVQYSIERIVRLIGETRVQISSTVESVGPSTMGLGDLSVRARGEIWFSVERGLMLSNDVDSQMDFSQRKEAPDGDGVVRTIMTMSMRMRLER